MKKIIIITFLAFSTIIESQDLDSTKLTGSLNLDSRIAFEETKHLLDESNDFVLENKKSVFLAGLFSFIVPGAGEFYTENYLKSAIFLAIEAAAITAALVYDKKGDDKTSEFEAYANKNWSVKRYARWTIENASNINSEVTDVSGYNVFDNQGEVNWSELNRLETDIGFYYSHRLAPLGDQQYYEMIGKYAQFNVGWEEFGDDPTKPFTYIEGDNSILTRQFLFYAGERGEANDFYSYSGTAIKIIIANHIISAIDAAWSASRFNKNLSMKLNVEKVNLGYRIEYYPELNLKYSF